MDQAKCLVHFFNSYPKKIMKQETIDHIINTILDENTSKDVACDLVQLVVDSSRPGDITLIKLVRKLLSNAPVDVLAALLDKFLGTGEERVLEVTKLVTPATTKTASTAAELSAEINTKPKAKASRGRIEFPYSTISQLYRDYEWRQYGELQITVLNHPVRLSAQKSMTCYVDRRDYVLLALMVSLGYDSCAKKMLAGLAGAVNMFCNKYTAGSRHKACDVIREILNKGWLDSSDTLVADISSALEVTPGNAWYAIYNLDEPCAARGQQASREAKLDRYLPAAARLLGKKIQAEMPGVKAVANVKVVTDLASALRSELSLTGDEPTER